MAHAETVRKIYESTEFFQALGGMTIKDFRTKTLLEAGQIVVALVDLRRNGDRDRPAGGRGGRGSHLALQFRRKSGPIPAPRGHASTVAGAHGQLTRVRCESGGSF
jgi:hypothetical protein